MTSCESDVEFILTLDRWIAGPNRRAQIDGPSWITKPRKQIVDLKNADLGILEIDSRSGSTRARVQLAFGIDPHQPVLTRVG